MLGVHTPEFSFEKDIDNVRRAVRDMGIDYPVAVDSDYAIWRAFDNHYWPALYLVDAEGRIRHHHFGEGDYAETETVIQQLLAEAGAGDVGPGPRRGRRRRRRGRRPTGTTSLAGDLRRLRARGATSRRLAGRRSDQRHSYALPTRLGLNQWALAGEWTIGDAGARR